MDSRDREAEFGKWYKSFSQKDMKLTFEIINDEGNEEEIILPAKFEVCGLCDGKGKHVNPSIDSEGISSEDFAEDPDFAESYFSGLYDVSCYRCSGNRVEPIVDEDSADKEDLKKLDAYFEERASYEREVMAERRMGC